MLNIIASALKRDSWRFLLRIIQVFHGGKQGQAEVAEMFRFLHFVGIPQLDLITSPEIFAMWIAQAIVARETDREGPSTQEI